MAKGTLLYSGGPDAGGAATFVCRLLCAVAATHMLHLGTRSYAQHMALGELYEGLQDKADALAETWQGCTGQLLTFAGQPVEMPNDALSFVTGLYEYVETARGAMGPESHIQNLVDEIASVIARARYKLTFLA